MNYNLLLIKFNEFGDLPVKNFLLKIKRKL